MVSKEKDNRNLIIIGNGFDLSLNLDSSINNYLDINSSSDYCTYHSRFNRIYYFIKLFHKCQKQLMYKIRMVNNSISDLRLRPIFLLNKNGEFLKRPVHLSKRDGHFEQTPRGFFYIDRNNGLNGTLHPKYYFFRDNNGKLILDESGNPLERIHIDLTSSNIARDYFVLKLFFNKHYKITSQSFSYENGKDLDPFKHYYTLDDGLDKLNKWGDKKTNELLKVVKVIKPNCLHDKVNFWNLLLFFELYIDIRTNISLYGKTSKHKFSPKTWYDVENTIKEYIISIVNKPFIKHSDIKYHKVSHSYHILDHYVKNVNLNSREHFNFFTGINRYINLLGNVEIKSIECSDDNNIVSYPLYNQIMEYSRYNEFLLHYTSHSSDCIGDTLNILSPFMFICLSKFGDSYINNSKSLFSFLRKQLKDFENNFSSYLKNQINKFNCKNYKKESLNHLNKLSVTSNFRRHGEPFNVLDFNYTPLDESINHYEHIHGSLDNNDIVIGIGEQAINQLRSRINPYTYSQLYSFTKTYQLFSFNKHVDENFLKDIKNIIFFGHSFGVNDFPYFEALFDHFNLYSNSKINLIFAYTRHNNKSFSDVKRSMIPRIINLLRDYGTSLSNKAHNDNFVSKMFAENRIRLYPVDFNKK